MTRATAAIVGPGNIGTDLLHKLVASEEIDPVYVVGVVPGSPGLARARELGIEASAGGIEWLLAQEPPDMVFEATSAAIHAANAPLYREAGIRAIDLTPAALGPFVVPPVNFDAHLLAPNINLITCGGQATIPIVHAVSSVVAVAYAEIVASVASKSAGPGTRLNIDEFTRTTAQGIVSLGGADRGKAIVILNPAEPPLLMRNTVFCAVPADADRDRISESVSDMVATVQQYVPGYRLLGSPQFDDDRVAILIEVEGAGDYLPTYAGNLDVMTAAATRVGELIARSLAARGDG